MVSIKMLMNQLLRDVLLGAEEDATLEGSGDLTGVAKGAAGIVGCIIGGRSEATMAGGARGATIGGSLYGPTTRRDVGCSLEGDVEAIGTGG